MSELASAARAARDALLAGDHRALARSLDASFEARARMLELDPRHVEMIHTARACGAGANYAGSGGSIVCACRDTRAPGRGDHAAARGRLRSARACDQHAGRCRGVRSMSELSNVTPISLRMTRRGPASTAPATCAVSPSSDASADNLIAGAGAQ